MSFSSHVVAIRELVIVVVVASYVEAQFRWAGLPTMTRRLGLTLSADGKEQAGAAVLPGWTRLPIRTVDRVMNHWPFGGTCLRRTLVLGHRLRGLDAQVRIGVQRSVSGEVAAHSWLIVRGMSIDPESARYRPLSGLA